MGKTRRHRIRSGKSNPLALTSAELEETLTLDNVENKALETVRTELLNPNVEEKLNALQALAVLTNSKDKISAICRSDLIRIAAPLLCERNQLAIRQATAGALRNLSVSGGPEVCEYLVEQDVLTPLLTLLNEYIGDTEWKPIFDKEMRGQMDLRSDIFFQSINLLWNLCESTSIALDSFNQTLLLDGVVRFLDYNIFGIEIAMSVAQFLLVLSENNPHSWTILNQHLNAFLELIKVETNSDFGRIYLSILAVGILSNIPALAAAHTPAIFKSLDAVLQINHETVLKDTLINVNNDDNIKRNVPVLEVKSNDMADEETEEAAAQRRRLEELPTEAETTLENVGHLIDAQKIAAEIITNFCSSEEEEWMDASDDDIGDSDEEAVCDYPKADPHVGSSLSLNQKLPIQLLEAVKSLKTIDKLWLKTQPLNNELFQSLRQLNIKLLMKSKNLRISSLIALQNLCNSLSVEDLGGPQAVYNVWVELGQLVFKGPQDIAILEPSTSLMRSALEHLKKNRELFDQMTQNDLELMLNGVRNCSVAEIRANWLRMLGTLGCLLNEDLVKLIIAFTIETCKQEEDVWTISESLDALMDMFADNDWPKIIVELNLLENCRILEKIFRSKLKQQKRELNERFPAVQTVRSNFTRFVKYVEQESTKALTNGENSKMD